MAHPTETDLLKLVGETGYDGRALERMIRLFGILQMIERDEFLRRSLALKGGTALNAFHIGLKRLSVDIDLQYIGPLAVVWIIPHVVGRSWRMEGDRRVGSRP